MLAVVFPTTMNAQGFGLHFPEGQKRAKIPFETFNNLIIIPVTINQSDTLNFIVDTGVRNTLLLQKTLAFDLGLEYARTINILGAASDQIIEGHVVNKVEFGSIGISGHIHSLLVIEEDFLKLENYFGRKVHGIIGYDLFRRFVVKINYDKKELRLYEPEEYRAPRWYKRIDFELERTKPYVNAKISIDDSTKIESRLMIDLGASHSSLLELESHDDLKLPEKYIESNLGRGLGGKIDGYKARIKSIEIGKFYFKDVIVSYAEPNQFTDSLLNIHRHGTLGGEILNRFHVVFDYLNNCMYLKKNKDYHTRFEYNLCGITLMMLEMGFNAYMVEDVIPGSPADEAGVQKGDFLRMVNYVPAHELGYDEITGIFHSRPNRVVKLHLNRDGNDFKVKIKLKRQI